MKKLHVIFLLAQCLLFCTKLLAQSPASEVKNRKAVSKIASKTQAKFIIPETFEGLSFETKILTADTGFLNAGNTTLIQLIKNLGPGILRIGGSTSDKIYWPENRRTANTTSDSLTKTDINRLSAFSKATGWPVLFGLNMGNNDPKAAANEALYVSKNLGSNLYAFQCGNEPDFYRNSLRPKNYDYTSYQADWETYFSAITGNVPGAPFAGPDISLYADWIKSFAQNENSKIKLLDGHYYLSGPATDKAITFNILLVHDSALPDYLETLKNESGKFHLPYRIGECNSIYDGGKEGVSDVFASALWALDFMWTVAENKGAGINFHDGYGLFYSPIAIKNGVLKAAPVYYAMLAFKYAGSGGTIVPANVLVKNLRFCTAYACVKTDGSYCFTLINRDHVNGYPFKVLLKEGASHMQIARLTAPSITSKKGITFGGAKVNADGAFKIKATKDYPVTGKSITVIVPAGSAAIVTVK